jgi:hypothetical protein
MSKRSLMTPTEVKLSDSSLAFPLQSLEHWAEESYLHHFVIMLQSEED